MSLFTKGSYLFDSLFTENGYSLLDQIYTETNPISEVQNYLHTMTQYIKKKRLKSHLITEFAKPTNTEPLLPDPPRGVTLRSDDRRVR